MIFIKINLLLQLLVEVTSVVSYTVVLKPVKPLYPVKLYRYELRHPKILRDNQYYYKTLPGTRLYPVLVKPQSTRTRVPPKKEKRKFTLKPPTTEKPLVKDQRIYGLPQQLVPPVSNQIEEYSENKEDTREPENDIRHLLISPPYDDKSFSSFGQEKGRIYSRPGEWATTAAPVVDSDNTTQPAFTPSQLYFQIRHKNTVIHVPQTEALKDAETLEELINAPRLKELARTTHVQEVYSEEGYEDAGYDHAGHIRHAQHGEIYDAKDKGKFHIKQPPVILDYDSDLEESQKATKNINVENNLGEEDKIDLRRIRSQTEKSKMPVEYAKTPPGYKGDHKFSSRVKAPLNYEEGNLNTFNFTNQSFQPIFPSYFGEMPPVPVNILANNSFPIKKSAKYRKEELNSTKIYPVGEIPPPIAVETSPYTNFKPFLSQIDSQASPSAKSLKYSRIYSKKTKQLRLEPYKTGEVLVPPPEDLQPPPPENIHQESINERIVLPTIGYINSLTTAHFGKGSSSPQKEEPKTQLTTAINLTEALNYLRSTKSPKLQEQTEIPTIIDIRTFEPMKLKSRQKTHKTKRDVYLIKERDRRETSDEDYEGNGEGDEPHNEKNEEIAEDERKRIEEENKEKEKYEKELREEISKKEKEILKETYKNIGVEEDISEVFPELPASDFEGYTSVSETTQEPVDSVKYPYYFSKKLPENSALRYSTDPRKFPRKSGYKMEFYDSRDDYIQCPDFHPNLEDLPNSNSTEYSDEQAGDNQRLAGVGDKIMCLKMKYFDRDPFDNPIFKEKEIDYVGKSKKHLNRAQSKQNKTEQKPRKYKDTQLANTKKKVSLNLKPKSKKLTRMPIKILRPSNSTIKKAQSVIAPKPKPVTLETSQNRIIPVTEIIDEAIPKTFMTHMTPKPVRHQSTNILIQHKPLTPNRMVIPHNCMSNISEIAAIDGKRNLIVDCKDAILVQELLNGVAYLRIIPKEAKLQKTSKKIWNDELKGDPNDWVSIIGYNVRHPIASRKTDEVKLVKNETDSNFDTYVIDELKEDENVRKGEVVEDMAHYMKMMENVTKTTPEPITVKNSAKVVNETREKRAAQIDPTKIKKKITQKETPKPEPLEPDTTYTRFTQKRTLTRLSGSDFLTRYHKNKAKPLSQGKTADFWKVSTPPSTVNSLKKNVRIIATTNTPKKTLEPTTTNPPAKTSKPEIQEPPKVTIRINIHKPEYSKPSARPGNAKLENTESNKVPSRQQEHKKLPELPDIREPPKLTAREYRLEAKQSNDFRKNTPKNPKNEYKQPETRQSFEFQTTQSPAKPENYSKISSVTDIVEHSQTPQTDEENLAKLPESKQEPQYKTINRNKKENSEESSQYIESTDGPTLYYVVDTKTGIGKWITDYEERKRRKFRKVRNRRPKTGKLIKKQE